MPIALRVEDGLHAPRHGPPVRVLIGDDHDVVRQGLVKLLQSEPDFRVVGDARSSREILRLAVELVPDVVVLDMILVRDVGGLEIMRQLRPKLPRARFVMLSMHAELPYVCEAFQHGAMAYVFKSSDVKELVRAVRAVREGQRFVSQPLTLDAVEEFRSRLGPAAQRAHDTLTSREREVLDLAVQGLSNQAIADLLDIGLRTVHTHRKSGCDKLDVHTPAQLYEYYRRWSLRPPADSDGPA